MVFIRYSGKGLGILDAKQMSGTDWLSSHPAPSAGQVLVWCL